MTAELAVQTKTKLFNRILTAGCRPLPLTLQVFIFATLHMGNSYMWVILPICLYFADVGLRWTLHGAWARATITVVPLDDPSSGSAGSKGGHTGPIQDAALSTSPTSLIKMSIPNHHLRTSNPAVDLQDGEYVYIQAPALGIMQWHPFSIAFVDTTHTHFLVKASGNWSRSLAQLAKAESSNSSKDGSSCSLTTVVADVHIAVEGPYDVPITCSVQQQLAAGAQVLLVAGGVGIASMVRTLLRAAGSRAAAAGGGTNADYWGRLHLVWVARTDTVSRLHGI